MIRLTFEALLIISLQAVMLLLLWGLVSVSGLLLYLGSDLEVTPTKLLTVCQSKKFI